LSLQRRLALLEWAAHRRAWVVEDDYDGEFRYQGQPLMPLRSIDRHSRVIFLGTLSKSMFVALRLAFIVVPEELVESLAHRSIHIARHTPKRMGSSCASAGFESPTSNGVVGNW